MLDFNSCCERSSKVCFFWRLDLQLSDAEGSVELIADFAGDDVLFSRGGFEPFDQGAAFEIGEDGVELVDDFFKFGEEVFLLRDRLIGPAGAFGLGLAAWPIKVVTGRPSRGEEGGFGCAGCAVPLGRSCS